MQKYMFDNNMSCRKNTAISSTMPVEDTLLTLVPPTQTKSQAIINFGKFAKTKIANIEGVFSCNPLYIVGDFFVRAHIGPK